MKKKQLKAGEGVKAKKSSRKGFVFLAAVLAAGILLIILYPASRQRTLNASYTFFIEVILILPGVMILMGLFAVWIKNEVIVKYLGHASGVRGIGLAFILGMMPTGPLYIAFPMAALLIKKGARVANIVIFLSAWACIKLPQELVEMRFMGLKFMVLRLSLTIVMVLFMGLFIEKAGGYRKVHPPASVPAE